MRFLRASGVVAAALVVATLVPAAPAKAANDPKVLVLQSETPWVGKGGTFEVRLGAPPAQSASASDLEYAISVHPVSTSRSAFTQTLTNRPSSAALAVVTIPFTEAVTDPNTGAITLDVGVQDPSLPRDRTRVGLRGAGVYPVAVELRTIGGPVRARVLTHLVFVPEVPTGPKLAVGIVVPVRAPIALQSSGADRLPAAYSAAIGEVAATLGTLPADGVLLNPSPETLAALARGTRAVDTAALTALRAIGADHTVIEGPFVSTQTPESTEADRLESMRRGNEMVTAVFGRAPAGGLSLIDDPSDDRLEADLATPRVILGDKVLQPSAQRITTAEPVIGRRSASRASTPALVADTGFAVHFANDAPPVLAAHHLLADLATIYFDNPGRFRSVVVNPPASWRANAALIAPLLAGLESSPILVAGTADRLFQLASAKTTPRTRVALTPPSAPSAPAGFASMRRTIASLQSVMVESPDVAQSFTDRLLIAQSAGFDSSERRSYTAGLVRALAAERRKFVLPTGGSLTLTARRGAIPITVRSTASYPAHVLLQLASDRLKFPRGSTKLITLGHRNTTQRLTVQSIGSGTFPLRVLLKSPDGRVVLGESRLTIRSTNASGVGIALSIGALAFLVIWWIRHHRGRRTADAAVA
ncbi:MAG: hypothetical protein H0U92_10675 [Actinobacteria bacterium]|nr:hypothetical protein [Actinomycetota bacterium]